jgi:hypothetical protein
VRDSTSRGIVNTHEMALDGHASGSVDTPTHRELIERHLAHAPESFAAIAAALDAAAARSGIVRERNIKCSRKARDIGTRPVSTGGMWRREQR